MMEWLIAQSLRVSLRVLLWAAVAPFVVARQLYRGTGLLTGTWVLATHDAIPCPGCGMPVALTGRWECGRCRYVFDGFAFARCGVCGAVPPYISCQRCGVGLRNPMLIL